MRLSILRMNPRRTGLALVALAFCTVPLHATNSLAATPSTISLTCNTATTGPSSATVVLKPVTALTGSATIAVTVGALSGGLVVTPAAGTTLNTTTQTAGLTYNITLAAGCAGASTGAPTFRFAAGGTPDVTITVNTTVTSTTSGLSPSPSTVTVVCVRTPGSPATYAPGAAQTVSVTSTATGGTPFTVDTVTNAPAAWLTPNPTTGGTATASTPVTFTVVAAAGCGGFAANTTNTTTVHLLNSPAPDRLVTVNLQVVPPTVLQATPSPASLSYTKGSGTAGYVDVRVTSSASPAPFFSIDTTSLPIWLTVDSLSGTVPKNIRFSSTSVSDTLAPGNYNTTVRLNVSGYGPLSLPVSLLVNNPAPKLSVAEGVTRNISWTVGQGLPTPYMTLVSTDAPIPYSITTGGTLAPIIAPSELQGLAYNFGTAIPVTFNPLVFASATPGTSLTGTVTIAWGNPTSTIVVTFNCAIQSPGATLTGISPASLPTATAGTVFQVAVTGTGFVTSTDPLQKTKVGIVSSGAIVTDTNIAVNVVNPSNILLTITVPATADANLPFSPAGSGGNVVLGLCNPSGVNCTVPTGQATLSIGNNPIISAVTSASSFLQVTAPTLQTIAPFDLLSVFGTNFCSSGGTGCSSNQVLAGAPDPNTRMYSSTLSPDAVSATQRLLSVTFQTHATPPVVIGTAPLLFATNNQINLVVPSGVSTYIGSTVDMVVNFGYGSGANMKSSAPYQMTVQATNPGIFTVGANGQGDGAVLSSSWALINQNNPAGVRSNASDSDTVQVYMTGLGIPDSTADNADAGSGPAWSTDCISMSSYQTSLNQKNGTSFTALDGALIQSVLLNTLRMPPCIVSSSTNVPSVTVGGVAATVTYAGWVADSVAGLYQLNMTLPGSGGGPFTTASGATISSVTAPVQLPVFVTANGKTSQTNVTVWVAPRLKVTGPSGAGLAGTVGVAWSGSNNSVDATEGTGPYQYIVSSGVLPSGLSLNASTGAISGQPAANTAGSYVIVVTAIDSANVPVTGSVSFTLTVAGGLFMTGPSSTVNGSALTANASLASVQATGGVYPYTYTITAPGTPPVGMTINSSTGVISVTGSTPAGTYHMTITATDSTTGTPLTGTFSFDIDLS